MLSCREHVTKMQCVTLHLQSPLHPQLQQGQSCLRVCLRHHVPTTLHCGEGQPCFELNCIARHLCSTTAHSITTGYGKARPCGARASSLMQHPQDALDRYRLLRCHHTHCRTRRHQATLPTCAASSMHRAGKQVWWNSTFGDSFLRLECVSSRSQ